MDSISQSPLKEISQQLNQQNARAILVGGVVRDVALGKESFKDWDVEVFNCSLQMLKKVLQKWGTVLEVGRSFGVLKLCCDGQEFDFSLPRTETKVGPGHRGFAVEVNSQMDFSKAASRRDFSINAMGINLSTGEWLDPFGGLADLKQKVLRHVGPSFVEDPLRVLRAMQFAARFELSIAPETVELCKTLSLSELARERIFEEWKKLLLKAQKPSLGLHWARKMGMLAQFPELEALIGVQQDSEWHPEGDVWIHTLMVVDEAAKLRTGKIEVDLPLMLSALCHDFGKPLTSQYIDGRWRSPGHDEGGVAPTRQWLSRLTNEQALIEKVCILVREHLRPAMLYHSRNEVSDGAIRRLALRVDLMDLLRLARADHLGRTTAEALARQFPAGDWLLKRAEELQVKQQKPTPWVKGRHLLQLGMQPGPCMGKLLNEAFELQLEGQFNDLNAALSWAQKKLQKKLHDST